MIDTHNKKTLHVLFTGLVTSGMVSGGDQLFLDIAPRLPKSLKIIVITPHFAKDLWKNIDQSNIEFRYLRRNIFEHKHNPMMIFLSYLIRSWQVYWLLRKESVQIIYSCSDIAYADIWPVFFFMGIKKINWVTRIYHVLLPPNQRQGNPVINVIAFYLQRISFWMMKKRSSHILVLNSKLYDEVLALGFPNQKLGILGAGIDFDYIHNFNATTKYDYDVVVLGRLAPVKGIFDTIRIWSQVHKRNSKLKIAWIGGGAENMKTKMEQLILENDLKESFHLLGFLDKKEVYNILKSARVFICPDHENGWGLAICEAMSAGLPVVGYDIDVFGSVYKKGYLTAKLFDTNAFANQLIKILENNQLRNRLAKEAVDQAKEFDHENVIKELSKFLFNKI